MSAVFVIYIMGFLGFATLGSSKFIKLEGNHFYKSIALFAVALLWPILVIFFIFPFEAMVYLENLCEKIKRASK